MIGWLWRVIVGRFISCNHKWEQIGINHVMENEWSKIPLAHKHVLRCEKCGDITTRRV